MDQWTPPAGHAPPPPPPQQQQVVPPPPTTAPQPAGLQPTVPQPALPQPAVPQQRVAEWTMPPPMPPSGSPPPMPPSMAPPPMPQQFAPMMAPAAPAPGRRGGWPGVLALVMVMVLTVGLGVQSWLLYSVSSELDEANRRLDELRAGQNDAGGRLGALEDRADALEDFAGDVFNPQEVANAVLPSVLMVVAGDFSGTAFAVGPETGRGGTNLFTNYHVIQQVWERGERDVALERTNETFPARIMDVAPDSDVAWLQTDSTFDGLATSDEVASGQQIVVVGAPQGLNDTVTVGVVSTPERTLADGSGPWIQFDAAVNPGNSGGPVINADQAVIGIASAKDPESEAIGYAVPIDEACGLFDICD